MSPLSDCSRIAVPGRLADRAWDATSAGARLGGFCGGAPSVMDADELALLTPAGSTASCAAGPHSARRREATPQRASDCRAGKGYQALELARAGGAGSAQKEARHRHRRAGRPKAFSVADELASGGAAATCFRIAQPPRRDAIRTGGVRGAWCNRAGRLAGAAFSPPTGQCAPSLRPVVSQPEDRSRLRPGRWVNRVGRPRALPLRRPAPTAAQSSRPRHPSSRAGIRRCVAASCQHLTRTRWGIRARR